MGALFWVTTFYASMFLWMIVFAIESKEPNAFGCVMLGCAAALAQTIIVMGIF